MLLHLKNHKLLTTFPWNTWLSPPSPCMNTNLDHTEYTDYSQEPLQLLNFKNFSELDKNGSFIYMSSLWHPPSFHDDQHLRERVFSLIDEDFGFITFLISRSIQFNFSTLPNTRLLHLMAGCFTSMWPDQMLQRRKLKGLQRKSVFSAGSWPAPTIINQRWIDFGINQLSLGQ